MNTRLTVTAGLVALFAVAAMPASAQTIPMHSGHLGHGSAQMKPHGSGIHYPNRPTHHHHYGFAGYRDPYNAPTRMMEANEAARVF